MNKISTTICAVLLASMAATVSPAFADEAKTTGLTPDDLKKALGMSIYLQGGYTYNGNASTLTGIPGDPGEENNLRVFDHKANSFGLDLAELVFSKDPAAGMIGYKVKVSAGETAKYIHSTGLVSSAADDPFDITEAYLSYVAPLGKGLRFDYGKMVTYHGAEVIEAIDNPNYSRSFLFNYAIPFTHTGLKMSYVFTDAVSASVHVVNGWDNSTDNNTAKTVGLSISVAPVEMFSAYINYMQGPEQADNKRDNRSLLDIVATIKPIKPLSIILNYDDAKEDNAVASGKAKWSGVAGIVKYEINDTYSISVRSEYFDDKDGVRTGIAQKLTEYTVTPEIRLANGLVVRPEYRHDSSNKESFDNSTKKKQDTLALGLMYRW